MKEPVVKGKPAVIIIPLGSSYTGPDKRFVKDLEEVSFECDRVRNAMFEHWLFFHRHNPDYQVKKLDVVKHLCPHCNKTVGIRKDRHIGQSVNCTNKQCKLAFTVTTPIYSQKDEDALFPECLTSSKFDQSFYRIGQNIAPNINTNIINSLSREVVAKLKSKMPYDHEGKRMRGLAILNNEVSLSNNRKRVIPVPNQGISIAYDGKFSQKKPNKKMKVFGQSECVLQFPLFSDGSGRNFKSLICRLNIAGFTPGQKALLRRVIAGEWKMGDSTISYRTFKRGNKLKDGWYFNLNYAQPRGDQGLNKNNTATLFSNPKDAKRAMQIRFGPDKDCWWQLGDNMYKVQVEKLKIKRKVLRFNSRLATRTKGHGQAAFYRKLRPSSKSVKHAQSIFQWLIVKDVMAYCVKNDCGTLYYREPSRGLRDSNTWFSAHGVEFDWTAFLLKLRHKCNIFGIDLVDERIKKAEYELIFPPPKPSKNGTSRQTEDVVETHVETLVFEKGRGQTGHQKAPLATGKVRRREVKD